MDSDRSVRNHGFFDVKARARVRHRNRKKETLRKIQEKEMRNIK